MNQKMIIMNKYFYHSSRIEKKNQTGFADREKKNKNFPTIFVLSGSITSGFIISGH